MLQQYIYEYFLVIKGDIHIDIRKPHARKWIQFAFVKTTTAIQRKNPRDFLSDTLLFPRVPTIQYAIAFVDK